MAIERILEFKGANPAYSDFDSIIDRITGIDSHTPNAIMLQSYATSPKIRFSSFLIPNQNKGRILKETAVVKSTIGQAPTTKVAFTFPTFRDKYYIKTILLDGIVPNAYINIKLAKNASSLSVSSFMIYPSFTSRTFLIDFIKIWKVPLMVKAEDTIILDITLPDEFLAKGETKTLHTVITYEG